MKASAHARLKRSVDLAVTVPLLFLSLPVQAIVALLVANRLGRPVLFVQTRAGRNARPFKLVKFRTMRPLDKDCGHIDDASRLSPFGAALRSTSLDELPTLWNIVRGDMSLVGPRPLLMHYLPRYTTTQARRHEVLPGLTGLAQIRGRNAVAWEERLRLDVEYVDCRSLALDLSILVRTVVTVLRREGIAAEGHVTMAEFTGAGSHGEAQ
jgi:lipopolysaccharide/colanic/teichoic acid biosynthesis glycosyltransferase